MHLTRTLMQNSRTLRIGMVPADGIGREVLPVAQRVMAAAPGAPSFEFIPLEAGFELFQKTGVSLPQETIDTLKNSCDGATRARLCVCARSWASTPTSAL